MSSQSKDNENIAATISPIDTKGNWFWKDDQRFLIKGVTYSPRAPDQPPGTNAKSSIDPLSEDWLPQLEKDISLFRQLGINAIFVKHDDPTHSPERALKLLQDAGIYVLVELYTNINFKEDCRRITPIDLQALYSPVRIRKNLAVVQQTAPFPNLLGYTISQFHTWSRPSTKLAALHRAAVRDTKAFLQKLGAPRHIPVGASMSSNQQFRLQALQYMSAGTPEERADFMTFGVYDWVGPSSFQISGWRNMLQAFEHFPVPILWGEYGTAYSGRKRILDEVDCLYSPDMTGVVSGGFLHTFGGTDPNRTPTDGESDSDDSDDDDDKDEGGYDLVRFEDDGSRVPKPNFALYQQKLAAIDSKPPSDVVGDHAMKDYENWQGQFDPNPGFWTAEPGDVPDFPLDWDQVLG